MEKWNCKVKSNTGGVMSIKYIPEIENGDSKLLLLAIQEVVCKLEYIDKRLNTLVKHLEIVTDEEIDNDND